jgi:thioredoxin reductase
MPPSTPTARLPVVVIGAGPVGLAAAAYLLERGLTPVILEAGEQPGASVAQWRQVRLFTPWCLALDPAALRLLGATGWSPPDPDALPTGADLLEGYLRPLAATPAIRPHLRLGHTVTGVARQDLDKVRSPGRERLPFVVRVRLRGGDEHDLAAGAVIDASGTWTQPNPLGANGLPALGERAATAHGHVVTGLPDILGADAERFAGRRVLVVGAGHSAATSLLALAELRRHAADTQIVWAVRSATPRPLVGKASAQADELPARGQLAADLHALVEGGQVELVRGFRIRQLHPDPGDGTAGVTVLGQGPAGPRQLQVDLVINATGFRPDHTIATELRLALDPALESAAALAPLIDPNVHTCGTVPAHGAHQLAHPDHGYWIVGMKSYGRAPTFLLATGYEQVRSVVAALVGDQTAAGVTVTPEPPTARFCRVTHQLLRSVGGRQLPLPGTTPNTSASVRELPSRGLGASPQDWGTVTCCQQPARIPIPRPATSAR